MINIYKYRFEFITFEDKVVTNNEEFKIDYEYDLDNGETVGCVIVTDTKLSLNDINKYLNEIWTYNIQWTVDGFNSSLKTFRIYLNNKKLDITKLELK